MKKPKKAVDPVVAAITAVSDRITDGDKAVATSAQRCLEVLQHLLGSAAITVAANERATIRRLGEAGSLGITALEVERMWDLIRNAARKNKGAAEIIEDVRNGLYRTSEAAHARWLESSRKTGDVTPCRGRAGKKVSALISEIIKDRSFLTDGQKSLALIERLVTADVLDIKNMSDRDALKTVVSGLGPLGVRECEFVSCWLVVKGVEAGRYPRSELDAIRSGASPCAATVHHRLSRNQARLDRRGNRRHVKRQSRPDVESSIVETQLDLGEGLFSEITLESLPAQHAEITDPLGTLNEILSSHMISLEAVVAAATKKNDAAITSIANDAKVSAANNKTRAARLLMSRAESCATIRRKS